MAPTLKYFKLRGRGEVIRLAFALKEQELVEEGIDYQQMKADSGTANCPFGQGPIFIDGDLTLVQMDAILRYVGRNFDLYGSNNKESSLIDMILGGVESIRSVYADLIYQAKLEDPAKEAYFKKHVAKESVTERNGGAHFQYLENLLQRAGSDWVVGGRVSIADIQLFDIVDLHLRDAMFPQQIKDLYPLLTALHARFAALPGVSTYLASDKRPTQINGVLLG